MLSKAKRLLLLLLDELDTPAPAWPYGDLVRAFGAALAGPFGEGALLSGSQAVTAALAGPGAGASALTSPFASGAALMGSTAVNARLV